MASQILFKYWNRKVHCCVHKGLSVTCMCPEPDQSCRRPPILFTIHINILLSTPWSCTQSPSFGFPHENPICRSVLPNYLEHAMTTFQFSFRQCKFTIEYRVFEFSPMVLSWCKNSHVQLQLLQQLTFTCQHGQFCPSICAGMNVKMDILVRKKYMCRIFD